jgi:lipopolysaccharide transport system ATP-binding protein
MATLVAAEHLGKRYERGQRARAIRSVREALAAVPRAMWRRLRTAGGSTEEFWALRDVGFTLGEGEVVGLLGRNGAGKTTLLRLLSAVTAPTEGRIEIRGRVGSLLGAAVGFHPELTGRENIFLAAAIMGMGRAAVRASFDAIVEFAEIGPFLDTATKYYSSGMVMKLGFAIAAHLLPEVLILDEVLAVGDHVFQEKALRRTRELARSGRTILLVSHSLQSVTAICSRVLILHGGRLVFAGDTAAGVARYLEVCRESPAADPAARTDRTGSGAVRCRTLAVEGPAGAGGVTGQPLAVRLGYEAPGLPRVEGLRALLRFTTVAGQPLFDCASALPHPAEPLPATGQLECRLPQLPLAPGSYELHLQLWLGDVLADALDDASRFEVEPGAAGGAPMTSGVAGGLLVPQEWRAAGRA